MIGAPLTIIIPFYRYLMPIISPHNDTHGDELADPILLPEQLIDI
jgi:hypothetical protein